MLKESLTIVVSLCATAVNAGELCADADQAARVQSFYSDKPGVMPVIAARRLELSEAVVLSGLAAGQSASAPGDAFPEIWSAMTDWEDATFLIMKGASVFEIASRVGVGKPSATSNYYNVEYKHPVRGHLRPDEYAFIYAIDMPGEAENETNRGVIFLDADGASVFSVFFSGDGPDPDASQVVKFDKVMALVKSQPSVCRAE